MFLNKTLRVMDNMIKVLHVGEYVQGGLATYIQTLLAAKDLEIQNYLVLSNEKSNHEWCIPDGNIFYYHYRRNIWNIIPAMQAIYRVIYHIHPDVIYCHSTWAGALMRLPLFFMPIKSKVLYNAHGWAFLRNTANWKRRVYAWIERILSFRTDKIVNVSKYEYDSAVRYGLRQDKLIMIYSGIAKKKNPLLKKLDLPKDSINLLFVGRFDPQKGLDLLLKAIDTCSRRDIHLYVIGDNIVSNGMGIEKKDKDRVTFLGWMPHADIAYWYAACDAVIMPSRWEAFGLVAIEAMKYGKPVLVSNCGALPELVENGINGLCFDIDTDEGIVQMLEDLRKSRLSIMGDKSKIIFNKRYGAQNMIKKTFELYFCASNMKR